MQQNIFTSSTVLMAMCYVGIHCFGGMESEPMLTPKGKSPLWGLRGGSNPQQCCILQDSEPNTLPTELFWPPVSIRCRWKCWKKEPLFRLAGRHLHSLYVHNSVLYRQTASHDLSVHLAVAARHLHILSVITTCYTSKQQSKP